MTSREILHEALLAGAADLARRAALLDAINVFPVVDADTGANMRRTTEALAQGIREGAADLGRVALLGARGNSGVILAEFLVGLFDEVGRLETFGASELLAGLERGAKLARSAVAEPKEGTILTAMSALGDIARATLNAPDLESHAALEKRLAEVVADTPRLMPRLREAGVVDSGALGFHVFASGLSLAFPALAGDGRAREAIRGRIEGRSEAPLGEIARKISPGFLADAARSRELESRYCVDAVIDVGAAADIDWEGRFASVGASVDVARAGSVVKVHVHADDPEPVRRAALACGQLVSFDFEDMAEGLLRAAASSDTAKASSAGWRVVADSSMSLSRELAQELGIPRLENYVGTRGAMFKDGSLDMDALFARMRAKEVFTTAQASAAEARAFVDSQLELPGRVLYFAVGRAYTGTQALVVKALEGHPEAGRFTVVDTRAASGQQGLAALMTARRARSAENFDALLSYAQKQVASCREYLALDTLEYLSRTGRVGRVKAAFAGALSVRPIVGHGGDGAITWAKVRSDAAAVKEVASRIAAHPGEGRLVVLLEHTDNLARVLEIRETFARALPADTEFLVSPLSATSSVHMGPGTWGAAATRDFS